MYTVIAFLPPTICWDEVIVSHKRESAYNPLYFILVFSSFFLYCSRAPSHPSTLQVKPRHESCVGLISMSYSLFSIFLIWLFLSLSFLFILSWFSHCFILCSFLLHLKLIIEEWEGLERGNLVLWLFAAMYINRISGSTLFSDFNEDELAKNFAKLLKGFLKNYNLPLSRLILVKPGSYVNLVCWICCVAGMIIW